MKSNPTFDTFSKSLPNLRRMYNHIYVCNINIDNIKKMLSLPIPIAQDIAHLLPRRQKERERYDMYLPDTLLNLEYANTHLDLPGAITVLEGLF